MKVMLIVGTRPEVVKMAPVYFALRDDRRFTPRLCVTGQHRQMLDQFLTIFALKPDHDLNIMKPNQDLFDVTSGALLGLRDVLAADPPDYVLVQGDTTTSFVGALAAFYLRVPIAHVEAGLRTHDLAAPFPEEANRSLIGRLADLHFAPTAQSRDNLLDEGVAADRIHVTGNTGIDALHWMCKRVQTRHDWGDTFGSAAAVIRDQRPFILVTGHRRENFGDGIRAISRALRRIARARPTTHIVYPVHLNPNVQAPITEQLGGVENIHLIPPLDYPAFVFAMRRARLILTDSGGIQEEAPTFGKPVLVTRQTTERTEALRAGTAKLVGANAALIEKSVMELLTDPVAYDAMAKAHNPFGDGCAAQRIKRVLMSYALKGPSWPANDGIQRRPRRAIRQGGRRDRASDVLL